MAGTGNGWVPKLLLDRVLRIPLNHRQTPSVSRSQSPYQLADLHRFVLRYQDDPHFEISTLSQSRRRRPVPKLRVGRIDGQAQHAVLLTARHHACETMASFALEGLLASVLEDSELGRWYREHVELLAITDHGRGWCGGR